MEAKPTVFVVDNEQPVLDSLCFLLKSPDWNVKAYSCEQTFLDDYDDHQPACLLLNVRTPGMGGLGLQEQLEAKGARLPIIIITEYGDVSVAVQAMKAGARDYIEKPFDAGTLLRSVRQVIEEQKKADVLIRITKQLTSKQAQEFYRDILPPLILNVLEHLDRNADVATVRRIIDHMSQRKVQSRLRIYEHVRDGIVDELCDILKGTRIKQNLHREMLLKIIEEGGVVNNLDAVEACLLSIKGS